MSKILEVMTAYRLSYLDCQGLNAWPYSLNLVNGLSYYELSLWEALKC